MALRTQVVATGNDPISAAEVRLYNAEVALHDARGSHVDAWIMAAADRLHDAIVAYLRLAAAQGPGPISA
jgi:hypothetical protein